jgi:hypothetical protein
MGCVRCGGFLVSEEWEGLADNVRDKWLRRMTCVRCVNCGSIDDSVTIGNRHIERSTICCTTH